MVKRLSFFEEIPSVQRTPDQLVEDIDNLARRIYQQMEDPQGLSHTILELSVKNIPKARQRFLKKIAVSERGCWEWRGRQLSGAH